MSVLNEQETALWAAYWAARTVQNRNALIEHYLPMIRGIAKAMLHPVHARNGICTDELLAEAIPGVIDCIERFDQGQNTKFMSFAAWRIRGSIQDALRRMDWVPRLERTRQKRGEVTPKHMSSLNGLMRNINFSRGQDDDPAQARDASRLRVLDQPEIHRREWWREVCRGLSCKQRLIVLLYWRCQLTMKEVGQQIGLSESRVSQMATAVIERIRERAGVSHWHEDLPVGAEC